MREALRLHESFDHNLGGEVHMEDIAQVFDQYSDASPAIEHANIASVLWGNRRGIDSICPPARFLV